MKKTLLLIVGIFLSLSVFSQKSEDLKKSGGRNEIKLNLFMTLFSYPEITYERIWSNVGLGVSAGFPLEGSSPLYQFIPYGRYYFAESSAKSFFIEGNVEILGYGGAELGLGIASGYKFVDKKGVIGEIYLGLGRTFGDESTPYPRVGISIGKRF
ncbi:MAG: hypothetical protein LBE91_14875 [Tannerella sp.]|nr:hypothetical protein [Tannerella sp.]